MAKKRKAPAGAAADKPQTDHSSKRSRLNINSYEDVAGSDDEFHINRDKILLDDGPEAKRRRKYEEEEEFLQPSDEEVLAYSSPSEPEDDDDEYDDDDKASDAPAMPAKSGRKAASGTVSDEDDEDEAEEEEEVGGWGSSKQDYYNADAIETEQDALDEEAEALRIQKKQLANMTAADFGFDENEWQDGEAAGQKQKQSDDEDQRVVTEILPQLEVTGKMGPEERLKLLKSRYPEFTPLSKDLLDVSSQYQEMTAASTNTSNPISATKQQAAAAYLGSLTMYFALLTSTADDSKTNGVALSASTIRDHPIMEYLIQCRDLWSRAKELPDIADAEEESDDEELELSDVEAPEDISLETATKKTKTRSRKNRAQKAAAAAEAEAEARRVERMRKAEADLADLDALSLPTKKSKKTKTKTLVPTAADDDSDFGEESELTAHEAAEKAQRKKSLRFYTSQIAQKANKRGAAGRNAGGDDDIPHRERLRDRQARLNAEAEKRGKKDNRDELGGESDDEDRRQAKELRSEYTKGGDSDEEYYDMVAAKASKKKASKQAIADAYKAAEEQGGRVIEREEVGPDGKRAITYAIEKNKGLTPHRKKDVRNPRVKKRKKYDEKKKKLASMRPVYKGGEGRGGYGGELTGIKKGLVRSTKL